MALRDTCLLSMDITLYNEDKRSYDMVNGRSLLLAMPGLFTHLPRPHQAGHLQYIVIGRQMKMGFYYTSGRIRMCNGFLWPGYMTAIILPLPSLSRMTRRDASLYC